MSPNSTQRPTIPYQLEEIVKIAYGNWASLHSTYHPRTHAEVSRWLYFYLTNINGHRYILGTTVLPIFINFWRFVVLSPLPIYVQLCVYFDRTERAYHPASKLTLKILIFDIFQVARTMTNITKSGLF